MIIPRTPTIWWSYLQTCLSLRLPFVAKEFSTLNQKFDIARDITLESNEIPSIGYICIGNGGHKSSTGVNPTTFMPVQHKIRHSALYRHMPFVLRTTANDLSPTERVKYRLRKIVEIGGVNYVAYYAKKLDLANLTPELELISITNGVKTVTAFNPDASDMTPIPPDLPNQEVTFATGDSISASVQIPFNMNEDDIQEYLNVANIIYGSEQYAIISEIGLCSGYDKQIIGVLGQSYIESIATQIANFIPTAFFASYNQTSWSTTISVGSTENLLNVA